MQKPEQTQTSTKDFNISKNNYKKFVIKGDKLIFIETGEIIDNIHTILDYYHMTVKLEKEHSVPKEYYYNNWLKGKKFTKLYQIDGRNYHEELSLQAKGLLFIFMTHLLKSTNEVFINGHRPTNKELMKLTGVSMNTLTKLFEELDKANLVKRKGNTTKRIILVNPYLCLNGQNIIKSTVKEFYENHQ